MFFFKAITALAAASSAFASTLVARQSTNTNSQIGEVLDAIAVQVRNNMFNIATMQANQTASDGTVGSQVQQLITGFNQVTSQLQAIPVSSGSTTVQPTDIELSRVFGEALQNLATGFSGIQAQGTVPNFSTMISQLDPAVAASATQLNTTLPGALGFVHTLMLDASQFLVKEGAWPETVAAIGF